MCRIRKRSDSVKSPLQNCQKGKVPQKSITQRLRADLGRSAGVTTATVGKTLLCVRQIDQGFKNIFIYLLTEINTNIQNQ